MQMIFMFVQCWGLNPGPLACSVPHPQHRNADEILKEDWSVDSRTALTHTAFLVFLPWFLPDFENLQISMPSIEVKVKPGDNIQRHICPMKIKSSPT